MASCLLLNLEFLLMSTTALAHGGGLYVLGTVTAIDEKQTEVKPSDGAAVSVKLAKKARFNDKGNPESSRAADSGQARRHQNDKGEQDIDRHGSSVPFGREEHSGHHPVDSSHGHDSFHSRAA